MKKHLFRIIVTALLTSLLPLHNAFSQEEPIEAAITISEEIQPNYHYEYIPDFTYEQVAERMIPFVAAYIDQVDKAARRITADWQPDY